MTFELLSKGKLALARLDCVWLRVKEERELPHLVDLSPLTRR